MVGISRIHLTPALPSATRQKQSSRVPSLGHRVTACKQIQQAQVGSRPLWVARHGVSSRHGRPCRTRRPAGSGRVSSRLRVAVVGAGVWGEQHARVFARRPDTELVAIVGRTVGRAEPRAAAYGTEAYTDIEEMLTRARRARDYLTASYGAASNGQHGLWRPVIACDATAGW